MGTPKSDILQGTLDLMVLQTLSVMGPMHMGDGVNEEPVCQAALGRSAAGPVTFSDRVLTG